MRHFKIKDFKIPTFLLEEAVLKEEVEILQEQVKSAKSRAEKIAKEREEWYSILIGCVQFKTLLHKCYPDESNTPLVKAAVARLIEMEFDTLDELKDFIASLLFAIYFSKGEDKVFDLNDPEFFNDEKCQALFDQEIYFPENWLDQFIRCLVKRDAEEDMILHNLTPEWLWPRCFTLLLELYKLTKEAIKHRK